MAGPKPGSIVHVEIQSNDLPRTKAFFRDVFGWKIQEVPKMNYTLFSAPGAPNGGFTPPQGGMGPGTLNHILSSEIDADVRRIESSGGAILVPKTAIPEIGWFAVFREPGGAVLALYQGTQGGHGTSKKPSSKPARKGAKARKRR
jgi:hypothetical protein